MSIFDEISSLDPLAEPVTSQPKTTSRQQDDFDKFATLFSPSTPRASPTLDQISLPNVNSSSLDPTTHSKSHTRTRRDRSRSTSSQGSEFGAFVSVSASEDPLSADIPAFEEDGLQTPMVATPTTATSAAHPEQSKIFAPQPPPRPSSRSSTSKSLIFDPLNTISNPSLSFFDQFAQSARERSATRNGLLDELLLHQDDPLYFLKDKQQEVAPVEPPLEPKTETPVQPHLDPPKPEETLDSEAPNSLLDLDINVHHDLDHDYFRIPPPPSSLNSSQKAPTHSPRQARSTVPTRSSSIPMPVPTLAPPIQSSHGATRSPSLSRSPPSSPMLSNQLTTSPPPLGFDAAYSDNDQEDSEDEDGQRRPGQLGRTSSFQSLSGSLSSLPVRWVSTLLRSAPPTPASAGQVGKPSLDSIFDSIDNDEQHKHSPTPTATPTPNTLGTHQNRGPYRRNSLSSQTSQNYRSHRSHASTSQAQPTFTHGSAFAPPPPTSGSSMSVSYVTSPFASRMYVPPTGAPGFTGESYGWDKGFSDELENERERERKTTPQNTEQQRAKTLPVVMNDKQRQERASDSSVASASKSGGGGGGGWGSSFGFSFGSVRAGKGTPSPSNSSTPPYKDGLPSSSSYAAGSEISWDTGRRGLGPGSRNGSPGSDPGRGGVANKRSGGSNGGGNGWSDDKRDDGIGAFIERKTGNVELVGRKESTSPILSPELAGMLRPSLPAISRLPRSWTLIYSMDQDGISLNTLYSKCEAHVTRRPKPGEAMTYNSAMLIVMKDADGAVFGSWIAEGIRLNKGGKGYFGGGESFLWKYTNGVPKIFKCSGKNTYIALCDPEYIAFGGGDGHYGLYLDDTLFDGSSAPCPTFDNEPLCSSGTRKGSSVAFECVGLEVWGMGP